MLFYLNNEFKDKIKYVDQTDFARIGWTEKDLENLISANIVSLIPENQLMILFQERPFDEAADIYALDKDGNLYIFELKRWKSNQENILQVLRYGQIFGQYNYEKLQEMLQKYMKDININLVEKHFEYFQDIIDEKLKPCNFNRDQYFIVITNGIDYDTLNSIKYWQDKGLKIDSIIYRIYQIDEYILFDFNPYNPEREIIIEKEEGYFIVNTNITWNKNSYKDMLSNQKASAYYDRKYSITRINKGDIVFLYHTGIGVIAYGKAIDNFGICDVGNDKNEEYFIKLKFDWSINPDKNPELAVTPWEINEQMNKGYKFRQTVFTITENMANGIIGISKNKTE